MTLTPNTKSECTSQNKFPFQSRKKRSRNRSNVRKYLINHNRPTSSWKKKSPNKKSFTEINSKSFSNQWTPKNMTNFRSRLNIRSNQCRTNMLSATEATWQWPRLLSCLQGLWPLRGWTWSESSTKLEAKNTSKRPRRIGSILSLSIPFTDLTDQSFSASGRALKIQTRSPHHKCKRIKIIVNTVKSFRRSNWSSANSKLACAWPPKNLGSVISESLLSILIATA